MEMLLVHIALLLYTFGVAAWLAWLVRATPARVRAARWSMIAGAILHAGALVEGATLVSQTGAWRAGYVLSLLAFLTVLGYLLFDRRGSSPVVGAFVAPVALSLLLPGHLVASSARVVPPRIAQSIALFVHVAASALGTAALALGLGLAVLYLAGEKQAKSRRPGRLFSRLTSLHAIDRGGYHCAVWGFIFLSLANVTGAVVSSEATGSVLPLGAKQIFAVLAWALLAVTLQARLVSGWRGRRSAVLVLVGSALVAAVYVALLSGPAANTLAAAMGVSP